MGGMEGLDYKYGDNKPIELNETAYYPGWYHDTDPVASSRVEAWEFMVGGGGSFNHPNARYTAEDPTGNTPDDDQVFSALRNLKNFLLSFDFIKMRPDQSFVLSGVPQGAYCRGLSQPGEQYALYHHHSQLEHDQMYYLANPGHYHETMILDIPGGTYREDWIDPASGLAFRPIAVGTGGLQWYRRWCQRMRGRHLHHYFSASESWVRMAKDEFGHSRQRARVAEFNWAEGDRMQRRTFLKSSVAGAGGLVAMTSAHPTTGVANGVSAARADEQVPRGDQVGRPVRIASISFPNGKPLEEIEEHVHNVGSTKVDLIALPELCRGLNDNSEEDLHGPTITAMAALAKKHQTYIVCPIDRRHSNLRLNTAVLLDRKGNVACTYDKVFPYWSEYDVHPSIEVGSDVPVYAADFGRVGLATCFDVNFPEVWKRLSDKGAEVVIWPSAYSAGTSLQAHAINHHYYIVSATQTSDCLVYDINGEKLSYEKSERVNVTTVMLDLDRAIYHENFNTPKRDKLLEEHAKDVEQERWMRLEQWFILRAKRPGVSARALAKEYGLEELRHYLDRSRRSIDERRGWQYEAKVLFPDLDTPGLKALACRAKAARPSGTTD